MTDLARLAAEVADLKRRVANTVLYGRVVAVDPATARIRLRLGGSDAKPFLSPWVPYAQVAGARFRFHMVPSIGQQMRLVSAAGDLRQGVADPFTWTTDQPSPSDEEELARFRADGFNEDGSPKPGMRIDVTADGLVVRVGVAMLVMREDHVSIRTLDGDAPGKYITIDNDPDHGIVTSVMTVFPDSFPDDRYL
jgi:phage baseplate assembly protein gpV